MISMVGTISAISDDKALSVFNAVAVSENDCSNILISKLRFTRRQYYSIMTRLMRANLVRRISGKYSLTSFGKVIFFSCVKIEAAIKCYWKLKAIDSILMSANAELPAEEFQRIVDNLLDNNEIKAIIVSNNICESQSYASSEQKKLQEQEQRRRHSRQLKVINALTKS